MGLLDLFSSKKEKNKNKKEEKQVLTENLIKLGVANMNKQEAIKLAGQLLFDGGYVEEEYLAAMLEREEKTTTFMGNGVAIPHGTNEAKQYIKKTGISLVQFPEGIDFGNGNTCYLLIGIAGKGDDHMEILQNLATVCQDEEAVEELNTTNDKQLIIDKLV